MNTEFQFQTDVLIVGSGPAGTSTSLFLSKHKIQHVIVDKFDFPRDKTCGDALSGKVMSVLKKIDPAIEAELKLDSEHFIDCWGVKFVAPNGKFIDVPFRQKRDPEMNPPGFISKRMDFDYFLFKKLDRQFADVRTGVEIKTLTEVSDGIEVVFSESGVEKKGKAKIVVGADGAHSVVAKQLGKLKYDDNYYSAGIRCYYENVTDLHPENFIELQFLKNLNPGYLWIFPLPNNQVNVGLGIPKLFLNEKNRQLKNVMFDLIKNDPVLSKRFKNAKLVSEVKGWGLPLGNVNRKISGNRFILTGDSGQLIDPFTGEGIGNAMMSGMVAADTIKKAFDLNDFSEKMMLEYDQHVYKMIGDELKLSDRIQKLAGKQWLFNFVVNRANTSPTFRELLTYMFENIDLRAKFNSPMFYLKLLFNR